MSERPHRAPVSISRRRGIRKVLGCVAFLLGIPLLLVTIVAFVFAWNNRQPDISVPTPRMPDKNAYVEFVRIGELAGRMKHKGPLFDTRRLSTLSELGAY